MERTAEQESQLKEQCMWMAELLWMGECYLRLYAKEEDGWHDLEYLQTNLDNLLDEFESFVTDLRALRDVDIEC